MEHCKDNTKYYVTMGANGVVIDTMYAYFLAHQQYLPPNLVKVLNSYDEAQLSAFCHLRAITPSYINIPQHFRIGYAIYVKKLQEQYEESATKQPIFPLTLFPVPQSVSKTN